MVLFLRSKADLITAFESVSGADTTSRKNPSHLALTLQGLQLTADGEILEILKRYLHAGDVPNMITVSFCTGRVDNLVELLLTTDAANIDTLTIDQDPVDVDNSVLLSGLGHGLKQTKSLKSLILKVGLKPSEMESSCWADFLVGLRTNSMVREFQFISKSAISSMDHLGRLSDALLGLRNDGLPSNVKSMLLANKALSTDNDPSVKHTPPSISPILDPLTRNDSSCTNLENLTLLHFHIPKADMASLADFCARPDARISELNLANCKISSNSAVDFAQKLSKMPSLKSLYLFVPFDSSVPEAFLAGLADSEDGTRMGNTHLSVLSLIGSRRDPRIQFYLALNRVGCRQLQADNMTPAEWFQKLLTVAGLCGYSELEVLGLSYYLLRNKPHAWSRNLE